MRVLIISDEPRLTGLVQNALGPSARLSTISEWQTAKNALMRVRFDMVCLDYECIRVENLDAVVSLRGLIAQKNTTICLLVRRVDADVERFQTALSGSMDLIDMSQGKEHFTARLALHNKDEDSAPWIKLEADLEASLRKMESLSKYEVFDVPKGCGRQVIHARYRELVKMHHPDVYGGNLTPRIKELSHSVFMIVKDHYISLLAAELDQPIAPTWQAAKRVTESLEETTQARIESLSGFKANRVRRERRNSGHGLSVDSEAAFAGLEFNSESFLSEVSDVQELGAEASAAERKQKVEALATRSQEVLRGNTTPARQAFNSGFLLYKEDKLPEALALIKRAYDLEPDPLNKTYYAHLLFRLDPDQHRLAEMLLRQVIDLADRPESRQALPDAHLFMGHLLKARNQPDKALVNYAIALKLNPGCVEAEREVRRAEFRSKRLSTNPGDFMKNLFKK